MTSPCSDYSTQINACDHYGDVIMTTIASQITSLTIVYSTVYPGADQRKHQSSASLAFVRVIHRGPVNSPHKWPVTRKMFPFGDVIMIRCAMRWRHVKFVFMACKSNPKGIVCIAQRTWQLCHIMTFIHITPVLPTDKVTYRLRERIYSVLHYSDVIIRAMASQITSLTIVYSTVYSGADQRKH